MRWLELHTPPGLSHLSSDPSTAGADTRGYRFNDPARAGSVEYGSITVKFHGARDCVISCTS